jgi:hypothetical protein
MNQATTTLTRAVSQCQWVKVGIAELLISLTLTANSKASILVSILSRKFFCNYPSVIRKEIIF